MTFKLPDSALSAADTATVTDEEVGFLKQGYRLTRVYRFAAGHAVRVRIERDFYCFQSSAVAEVLNRSLAWTELAKEAPSGWHSETPGVTGNSAEDADRVIDALGGVAHLLACRAASILNA